MGFLNDRVPECENFYWYEVLYLPRWKIHVVPPEDVAINLMHITSKLQWIREYFGRPIKVTSGYRPELYNALIGGAYGSAHMRGMALDFQVKDMPAAQVRKELMFCLERLDIRMEDHDGNWNHIDSRRPGASRFFKP